MLVAQWRQCLLFTAASLVFALESGAAAQLSEAERLFWSGKYDECVRLAAAAIDDFAWDDDWYVWKAKAELAQGKYETALHTIETGLGQFPAALDLRLLGRTALRFNNRTADSDRILIEATQLLRNSPEEFRSPADRVALGRVLLERGVDPRQVLELLYDPVRQSAPQFGEVYLATAELALDKRDNRLAAQTLNAAPKSLGGNPQYHYLLARAYDGDEPQQAAAALKAALDINPVHLPSLLIQVDKFISAEEYAAADHLLKRIFQINSNEPTAWAYAAVIAHLRSDGEAENAARAQALSTWKENPEVDHLIGRKLSENYRFSEGAEYQRKSLKYMPKYRPAKLQLAQDLLRLGEEEEGWKLAEDVATEDGYNVVAFNLTTLKDAIAKFQTLGNADLHVRMDPREAALYGDRVVNLLEQARKTLCAKYEVTLSDPLVVEIFPRQKDFDVRTFGMPGVARGYLGVCFGRVITANSPASQGAQPANWEAVLWHEFCHVITLHKTRNKMPRWLSEGISVYEERQANSAWGQSMTPEYRELILEGGATPVSQLSSAFLAPPTPLHLQFAYFESSLVVEYIIEKYGLEKLRALLDDLGKGKDIHEALVLHTTPLNRLDADFALYLRQRAEGLATKARWNEPELPPDAARSVLVEWLEQNPNSVPGLKRLLREQIRSKQFQQALVTANHLQEVFPNDMSNTNAYAFLATIYRQLNDSEKEQGALQQVALRDDNAFEAFSRLAELAQAREDWNSVGENARRMLAVNPLVPSPHRSLALAAERLDRHEEAIKALQALLEFDATDIAETHFRLARQLRASGQLNRARRHVLLALEEAPRYLAAHQLLLELKADPDGASPQ